MARLLRLSGFQISLVTGASKRIAPEAQRFWDGIIRIRPSPKWRPSSSPSALDSWYTDGLGESFGEAMKDTSPDVVLFNYVFHTKALEFLPPGMTTILDTHEVFSPPSIAADSRLFRRGFFSCTREDERRYLDRADKAVAISDADLRQFETMGTKTPLVHIPFALEERKVSLPLGSAPRTAWGLAMSANDHNLASLRDFIHQVLTLYGSNPPFRVVIAGDIDKLAYRYFPHRAPYFRRKWITYLGHIREITELYRQVTGIVVPVTEGNGMAIKFAHPLSYGMPIVSTSVGSRGSSSDHPLHILPGNAELVAALATVTSSELKGLSLKSQQLQMQLRDQVSAGWKTLGFD